MTKRTRWLGDPPIKCDLCREPIVDTFIDGRTTIGAWANMCPSCHKEFGAGLGTGRGQKYEKQPDGIFCKVEG